MRNLALLAAATLAVNIGTWSYAQNTPATPSDNASGSATATDQNANAGAKQAEAAGDKDVKTQQASETRNWTIRHELASTADDALSKNGFDNLVARLAAPDRDRIKKEGDVNKDQPDLQAKIDQINKDWKDKYGHDFKLRDSKDVFADATVEKGEQGRTPTLASEVNRNTENATQAQEQGKSLRQEDMDKGRDIAMVVLPPVENLQEIRVPLIHEHLMQWKINAPDTLTYQKLHDNLLRELTYLSDNSKWPQDEKQAERVVARHILMAVLDLNANGSSAASGTALPAGSREEGTMNAPSTQPSDLNAPSNPPSDQSQQNK